MPQRETLATKTIAAPTRKAGAKALFCVELHMLPERHGKLRVVGLDKLAQAAILALGARITPVFAGIGASRARPNTLVSNRQPTWRRWMSQAGARLRPAARRTRVGWPWPDEVFLATRSTSSAKTEAGAHRARRVLATPPVSVCTCSTRIVRHAPFYGLPDAGDRPGAPACQLICMVGWTPGLSPDQSRSMVLMARRSSIAR